VFDLSLLLARVDDFSGVWGAEGSKGAAMWDYCREIYLSKVSVNECGWQGLIERVGASSLMGRVMMS
jgi:hypothetical protein